MRAVVQRIAGARVEVGGEPVCQVGDGLLVYVGVERQDTPDDAGALARKVANLRIFPDAAGKLNLNVLQAGGQALVVSAFTCQADARKGNRPSFERAAPTEQARQLYEQFVAELRQTGLAVHTGVFGEFMQVRSTNDGPVVILLDSKRTF